MQVNKEIIIKGWERSGIGAALKETQRKEDHLNIEHIAINTFSWIFIILSTHLLPCLCYACLFYALYCIIKMATLLLGFFERCAKLKLSEYIVFRVREIKSREFKTERK